MPLDSGNSTMFGSKNESSQDNDPDLEDGEIASDEEGVVEPSAAPPQTSKIMPLVPKADSVKVTSEQTVKQQEDFNKALRKLQEDVARKKEEMKVIKREGGGGGGGGNGGPRRRRFDNSERMGMDRGKKRKPPDEEVKNRKEKRRKQDGKEEEDVDEDEMLGLCPRGASPTLNLDKTEIWSGKQPVMDPNWFDGNQQEYDSDFDERKRKRGRERRGFKPNFRGEDRETKKRIQMKRKGKNRKDMDVNEMICINFMKGNCNKGNDCFYSHAVCPPKKMELCKFYLMDCCAKRDKCLYLHDEFPCKFYHTGMKCYAGKKCKFSHEPLNSLSKDILLKHLESAPKEILGDFPRLSRENAETMVNNKTPQTAQDSSSKIPSLFDIQVAIPPQFQGGPEDEGNDNRETPPCSPPPGVKTSPPGKKDGVGNFYTDEPNGGGAEDCAMDFAKELEAYKNKQMMNKVEAMVNSQAQQFEVKQSQEPEEQMVHTHEVEVEGADRKKKKKSRSERKKRRREGEERWKDGNRVIESVPVSMSEDGGFGGIKFKIINKREIRQSTDSDRERDKQEPLLPMRIEKPSEFVSSDDERPLNYLVERKHQANMNNPGKLGKFGVEEKTECEEDGTDDNEAEYKLVIETNDGEEDAQGVEETDPVVPRHLPKKQQELFMRIQSQQLQQQQRKEEAERLEAERQKRGRHQGADSHCSRGGDESDKSEGGRTPSPDPADENWYSSDDEDKDNPLTMAIDADTIDKQPVLPQSSIETTAADTQPKPKFELPTISDFSKINITELLSSIRQVTAKSSQNNSSNNNNTNNTNKSNNGGEHVHKSTPSHSEAPVKINFYQPEVKKKEVKDPRLRDPRTSEPKHTATRRSSDDKKSIYDCANFNVEPKQDSDFRFQAKDSDERFKTVDSTTSYGDVDLRTLPVHGVGADGDFDLRKFGLPFKPVPVHTAATEIEASLTSHAPINYKVLEILIPRPDFSSIKVQPNDPQVKKDPRLRRLFRVTSSDSDPKEEQKKAGLPSDPRQRKHAIADTPKSPDTPFSPKADGSPVPGPMPANSVLLALAQLGLSTAANSNMFDPRLQQLLNKNPQELEMLRNQLSSMKNPADFEMMRNQAMGDQEMIRPPGLLPTPGGLPVGVGLLGPAPPFMMQNMGMPDPSMMMGGMSMGPPNMGFDPRFSNGPGPGSDDNMADNDGRHGHFNRGGFRNDRRGRGSWRGNRERNWDRDSRRHNKREERGRHRDRDERGRHRDREERRDSTPPE